MTGLYLSADTPETELLSIYNGVRKHLGIADVTEFDPAGVQTLTSGRGNVRFRPLVMYTNRESLAVNESAVKMIDMRSDTVSLPTNEMRNAMASALVGDDVFGEDPTTNELQERFAKLFNKEAAIFVPSGSMANLISVMAHCSQRGSEAIVGDLSHIFLYEQGSSAHIAGVQLNTIANKPDGTFCLEQFKRKIRGDDCHEPITALAVIENTHNMCGGKVIPLTFLDEFTKICRQNSIKCHMDGARLFAEQKAPI
ncbi:hypothetical protein Bhyg_12069 [Pseudolycoriella hygida]|uniref:Aromatic amino acid beta-eliminating lyase/threonine aldolase domain-containing protein n=1 Tax=Pseudolycoriella hygida TaxID=35572 RepID=A0A9Q0MWV1_9DIPT|nr:hypothetical protein Bhyg_12069 [Pseudolycoriella hygida]